MNETISQSELVFTLPVLLFVYSFAVAAGLVLAVYLWLWRAAKTPPDAALPTLWGVVMHLQYGVLAGICFVSFVVSLFAADTGAAIRDFLFFLVLLSVAGMVSHLRKDGFAQGMIRTFRFVCLTIVAVAAFWALTFLIGAGIGVWHASLLPAAVMVAAGIWNVPLFFLYRRIDKSQRRGVKFYNLLVPVMAAYLCLMLPLMALQLGNSEEWRDMINKPRPPRSAMNADPQHHLV